MEDIFDVLSGLLSPINATRKAAEAYFEQRLENHGLETTQALLSVLSSAEAQMQLRSFAGVLMRRAIEKSSYSVELESQLRSSLLSMWKLERDPGLLKRLSHAMAQSAIKKDNPWLDLLPSVLDFSQIRQQMSEDSTGVFAALVLVEVITQYCPSLIFAGLQCLGPFLGAFLVSHEPLMQTACTRATCACIVSLEDDNARNAFKPALQQIIRVLGETLSRGDELEATAIMEYLVLIAQDHPIFFKESMDSVVGAMLVVARADNLDFPTRSMALELMVTLTETAPALARRCSGLVEGLVPLAMSVMLEVDQTEADWIRGKYLAEPEDENYFVGEEALERAAAGMGGRVLIPHVMGLAQQYFSQQGWPAKRAAISALCRIAEGCAKSFKAHVPGVLNLLESGLSDVSRRVCYQTLETIGRFAILFPQQVPELVNRFAPTMIAMMQNGITSERVRGHVAAALIDLTDPEYCSADIISGILEPMLQALSLCLQAASIEVQPFCLDLLGRIAQVSDEAFLPYYNSFMPGLKNILQTATSPDLTKLRGKAMTCISTISEAVGPNIFAADSMEVVCLILGAMPNGSVVKITADIDIVFDHILPACARISKTLGPQFEQFLPTVMAPLLAAATQEVECSIVDAGVEDTEDDVCVDEETGTNSMVFDFGAGVKKRVTLNTHAVQQKKVSAEMIYEFATNLRGHMRQYLALSFQAVVPMLTSKLSSEVRSSASLALAKLFEALLDAYKREFVAEGDVIAALSESLTNLLYCLQGETNATARACAAEALRDVLQACYQSGVETVDGSRGEPLCRPDLINCSKIIPELLMRCSESLSRRREHERAFTSNEGLEAEDRGVCTEELDEEEELLRNLTDAIGQLIKLHGEAIMSVFEETVLPIYTPFLSTDQPAPLQIVAVCMFDDIIEFGGGSSQKYLSSLIPIFLRNLQSDHPVLRQCSTYGIAQSAKAAPALFAQYLHTIVPALLAVVNAENSGDEDNEGTTENALYALGIIVTLPHYRAVGIDVLMLKQISGAWLRGLPLRADEQEAMSAHLLLCDSLERGDAAIFGGETFENISEILRVLAEILDFRGAGDFYVDNCESKEKLAHPDTLDRMNLIVRGLASGIFGIPTEITQAAFSRLESKHQGVLKGILVASPCIF